MRTSVWLTACLVLPASVLGQDDKNGIISGTVKYTETFKIEIHLEGEGSQFSNLLPKERKSGKILYFSPEASVYQNERKDDQEEAMAMEDGGAAIHFSVMEPDDKWFTDLKNRKTIEQREFMTRMFLVEGEMEKNPWKLTGNEKEVLGYVCQEAILEKDSSVTVAWFTPLIPVTTGPAQFNNLPGLVLEVDIDHGRRVITATSIDGQPIDPDQLARPREGKKVTAEEFRKIVDEKMKEMNIEGGRREVGSGNVMVISIQK